jgi:hypothetical protein
MKDKIIHYLKTDRSYRGGLKLVHEHSMRLSLKKQLNVQPQSEYLHGVILEELRELAQISRVEFAFLMKTPVVSVQREEKTISPPVEMPDPGKRAADGKKNPDCSQPAASKKKPGVIKKEGPKAKK